MLEGDSQSLSDILLCEVEAESNRICGPTGYPLSAKVDTDNNTFDSPSSSICPDPPSPSPAAPPLLQPPTGRLLFFGKIAVFNPLTFCSSNLHYLW
ncbi:hypothetical protein DSO57_1039328 [Entomophthora muscae]|uniref:Uncharacterized protein n=1 Tax=Entomophthora muscae TaxID=34485 RepID=A0ACC2SYF3_9FUNG|nr:hypothetical protein DSO57_1039328 [Entomophthora muscae]